MPLKEINIIWYTQPNPSKKKVKTYYLNSAIRSSLDTFIKHKETQAKSPKSFLSDNLPMYDNFQILYAALVGSSYIFCITIIKYSPTHTAPNDFTNIFITNVFG